MFHTFEKYTIISWSTALCVDDGDGLILVTMGEDDVFTTNQKGKKIKMLVDRIVSAAKHLTEGKNELA